MECKLDRAALVRELGLLRGVLSSSDTIPILTNVLIEAEQDRLMLKATDLDLALSCELPANVKKTGSATLPLRRLFDYVRLLPDADVVFTSQPKDWVGIASGGARARMAGMSPESFPKFREMPEASVEVPARSMAVAIARTEFAISHEQSRFTLDGALFLLKNEAMQLVATDGHRLAISTAAAQVTDSLRLLIPRRAIAQLTKLLAAGDLENSIEFAHGENEMFFRFGGRLLASRMLTGSFPDYERILPTKQPHVAVFDRACMVGAIERVDQFSDERSRMIRVKFAPGEASFSSSISEVGASEESIPAEYAGPAVEIGFNAGYLLDFLKTVTENQVSFLFNDPASAGELRPVGVEGAGLFRYVVMPMRV